MGEKRISVGTSISRVIPDLQLPNFSKTGLTKALFQAGDINEHILDAALTSIAVKAERMYVYGRDHYVHGLPSGQFNVAGESIDTAVGTVLLSIENAPVELDYIKFGSPNNLHIGWLTLIGSHGYDPATNQLADLTAIKGTPVYLHDMVVVVPVTGLDNIEPQSLELWGIAAKAGYTPHRRLGTAATRAMVLPTPVEADPLGVDEVVRVEYVWEAAGELQQDSFIIPITGFDDEANYFHVRYLVGGVAKYWMYKENEGTWPALDALFDEAPLPNGSFFPFAYFRYEGASQTTDPLSSNYLTSKKLVSYLGMDYDRVAEAIEANPGIDDVHQALLMLAVPANTTNELEERYLWEFFNSLYLASSTEFRFRTELEAAAAAVSQRVPDWYDLASPGIIIQDSRFKMALENKGVYKRRKSGSIGAVGSFNSSLETHTVPYTYQTRATANTPSETVTTTTTVKSHYYRKQISTGFYDEIQVVELRTLFYIYGRYKTIGDELDPILLVPLDKSITQEFSIPDREILYARSLHFVFNSLVITKLAWYQTDLFQAVVFFVSIYMIVSSWGTATTEAMALWSAGSYAVVANILIMAVVEYYLTREIFKLFVKAVGIDAAFAIAIVAAMSGVIMTLNSGSLAGAPFAKDLLSLSSNLYLGMSAKMQDDMGDLIGQAKELDLLQKEQIKALETAQELLENNNRLDPFVIFGEKPDDFYNRTVHSGNIGVVGISAISSYVDYALKLPELNDTLGETL